MKTVNDLLAEMTQHNKELAAGQMADYLKAWRGFTATAHRADTISRKDKELIAVAISVAKRCERCIAYHVRSALLQGAEENEILEACFVAVIMEGGPALAYIGVARDAITAFKKEKAV